MGMLFNTAGTLRIAKMLTRAFSGQNFHNLQQTGNAAGSPAALIAALRSSVTTTPTLVVAQMFGVHQDIGEPPFTQPDPTVTTNWGKWLRHLDATPNVTDPSTGKTKTTVVWVREAIADSIAAKANCVGVEFFAVPGSSLEAMLPFQQINDPAGGYTLAITLQTITVDRIN